MRAGDVIDELREVIEARSLLKHPFYQAWQRGELRLEDLSGYAEQYYAHVLAFPQYVSSAHAICPDQGERQELLENLIEEERGEENHPELWLRFAEGVGATRAQVEGAAALPRTRALVDLYREATSRRSFAEACAALYVYESQVPEVAKTKIDGLKRFYGIDDARSLEFFEVHIGADEVHAEVGAGMVRRHATDDATRAAVMATGGECAGALWSFLDGVYEAYVAAPV
jgi:pyrroloquinoline-quinone synthase